MRVVFAMVLALVIASSAHAQDRARVVLGTIEGGSAVSDAVRGALTSDARVDVVQDAGTAQIVIEGAIRGRARRRVLALTATDGGGRTLATARARAALPQNIETAVAQLLSAALPLVMTATTSSVPSSPVVEVAAPSRPTTSTPPRPTPPAASSSTSSFGEGVPLFVISVGAGMRSRDTTIHVAGGMTRTYHASPFAELYARVDARPLGNDPSYARGLFLWGEAGYALGLSSQLPDRTQVSTTFLRLGAHVGYLLPIDSWLEVGASFGFGWERYDLGANVVLPTTEYSYLRPALRVRFRIIGELFVLGLEGGYRALLSRGGLSDAFGAGGDSFGYDLAATISGSTDFGLYYGVEAGWMSFVHQFSGMGTIADGTDGTDGGYRFLATLGYALR